MGDFNNVPPPSDGSGGNTQNDFLSALATVKALAARAQQTQPQQPLPPQHMFPPMGMPPPMMHQQRPPMPQQQQQQQRPPMPNQPPGPAGGMPLVKRGPEEPEGAPDRKRAPSSSTPPPIPGVGPNTSQAPPLLSQPGQPNQAMQPPPSGPGQQQPPQMMAPVPGMPPPMRPPPPGQEPHQQQQSQQGELGPDEEVDNMPIPSEKVGMVIGKGGETINRLQEQSGARLQVIQDDPFAQEKPLRMTGRRDAIERAKQLVKDLIDPEPEHDPMYPSTMGLSSGDIVNNLSAYRSKKVEIKVPRVAVGRVIGRGGDSIKRIQAESGARVQFEPETNQDFRIATITGTMPVIEAAEKMIMDIIQDAEVSTSSARPRDDRPREPMPVPQERAGLIIGRGGESIRMIMQQSGAHVELDRAQPAVNGDKTFWISGDPEQIATAKRLIQEKLDAHRRPPPRAMQSGPPGGMRPPQPGGFPPQQQQQQQPSFGGGFPGHGQPPPPGQQQQQQQQPGQYGGYYGQQPPNNFYSYPYGYQNQPPPPTQPPPPPGQQPPPPASTAGATHHQQPPPPTSKPPATSEPQQQQQQQAVPPGYPTHEQYLQYKEWYNAQGYFGYPPAQGQGAPAQS
ncbi:hypothetical protein PTSG_12419 [Salpingoeca rosetta]|uniref:K Homology domain-containing protein n=1 Tax=Salpingoeca rosetta (strain ATCC 50818 / BSB-021) TaxID=946362 RepID=F2UCE3_SALR5|nr:uncharacterized protein PTSG_12419 [Salpingoeca rosetta]EGD74250.1 hypothetical protein PTSG_12419 [Salpingoeca rosetta]|eukprot:XP_004993150.1 hypothetical protein PTSG_12419 [Salpingoeca rosetta]